MNEEMTEIPPCIFARIVKGITGIITHIIIAKIRLK